MKILIIPSIFFLLSKASADSACLSTYTISADSCTYDALLDGVQEKLNEAGRCGHDALSELKISLEVSSDVEVKEAIASICAEAYLPFSAVTNQGPIFDKEYFDGGTYYNEERQYQNKYDITEDELENDPGSRIEDIYDNTSQSNGITWPDNLINFENCELRSAMCCFVQDRQAGDNNGNCGKPYDEKCVDANPADNTDICYVDLARAPTSSRTSEGFTIFEDEAEDDSHCHGFAWATDPTDKSSRFKGNNLFYVSMYDHFTERGYVRNVPGAPMCGCVEQMPVVSRSDCTQIDVNNEDVVFSFSTEDGLRADIEDIDIEFNSCQGANNNNNDLSSYYEQLVIEGKATQEEMNELENYLVGETYCREAIDSFLDEQGLAAKPECRYGYPSECGCEEVSQKDYRGTISTTASGLECQAWDSQSPQRHSRTRNNYPDAGLVENYCRNPDNEPGGAWCYTTDPDVRWQYCDVPICGVEAISPQNDAEGPAACGTASELQADYRGTINTTNRGQECQAWSKQTPHRHSRTPRNYPDKGLESNYCRNPDNEPGGAWCYTTDPKVRWKYCDVPTCETSNNRNLRA